MTIPTGTITFLFTDIEGSTRLWENAPETMRTALAQHDAILRETVEAHNGFVFKTVGDAFYAAFADPAQALIAALNGQKALLAEMAMRVRMALHTGAVEARNADYFGPALNRVARLLAAGHGAQILLSDITQALVSSRLPQGVSLGDLGRHPLKDLPEPMQVWQVRHPDLPDDFPPLRALPAAVHYLPQTLTGFIGREREAADAEALLRKIGIRLVTLNGFGGMGKSRLAMQIAVRCLLAFPEGIWWLEMEEMTSGEGMFARIAARLGIPLQGEGSVREQVRQALRERNLLLVLDNLEQIPDAAEAVRDLLAGTAGVKCLVTSRRALGLNSEHLQELMPMPTTDAEALFVERVRQVKPDFAVNAANQEDVIRLCKKLEGIPLAIELAAARGVLLTPRQILERLSERFRLLQSRSPDLPVRQRALAAIIEWSYLLLPEEERAVFAQLAVFAGGFTMEDVEAVCEAFDVFESVEILRCHSFFRVETDAVTQETRFLMLDSVREYAIERLRETADGGASRHLRHAGHFLEFARKRLSSLRAAEEVAALRDLEINADNLRAAAQWTKGRVPLGAELAQALGSWRQRLGFLQEAVETIQAGLDSLRPHQDAHIVLFAELLRERAGLHLDFKEVTEARRCAQEAHALCSAQNDMPGQAKADNLLGQAAMYEGEFSEARASFSRSLDWFTRAGQPVEIAIVHNNLGLVARRDHSGTPEERAARLEQAETHLAEALRLRRALEDRRGLAETLNNLGVLAQERGNLERAKAFYQEALSCEQEVRNSLEIGLLLANLGEVAQGQGEADRAVRLFAASERFLEEVASPLRTVVNTMTLRAAEEALLSPEALIELRVLLHRLPSEERIASALRPSTPGV